MKTSTVLFLAANPLRVQQLQLGEECRAVEDEIRRSKFRDQIRVRSRWAARPEDLLRALNEDTPSILHFSGHGTGDQGICFQSDDGSAVSVRADGLAQVVRAAGASVVLVVLNACYSEVQAQALVEHVPCVIGMSSAIGDDAAIHYAAALYGALAFGKSVANAHQQGLAALALRPAGDQSRDIESADAGPKPPIPTLLTRPDIDADRVYLVQPPEACAVGPEGSNSAEIAARSQAHDHRDPDRHHAEMGTTEDQGPRTVEVHRATAREAGVGRAVRVDAPGFRRRSSVPSTDGEPTFMGREEELRAIEDLFVDGRVVVLYGAPGLGKTRLAKEYAQRHDHAYPGGMFLVPLTELPPTELARLLRDRGRPAYADESLEERCRRALLDLGSDGRVLILYDAVADERTLRSWLPYKGLAWHLIVTSTSDNWAFSWNTVKVSALDDQAAHVLVSGILGDDAAAARLVGTITEKAAGITTELCATATAAYEQLRRGRPVESATQELAGETIASFEAAWRLLSRDAQVVLGIASALGHARVPAQLIVFTLGKIGWNTKAVETAIDEARDRSLASGDAEWVDVHPLVARFVRNRALLAEEIRQSLAQALPATDGSGLEARGVFDAPLPASTPTSDEVLLDTEPSPRVVAIRSPDQMGQYREPRWWSKRWSAVVPAFAVVAILVIISMNMVLWPKAPDALAEPKTRPYEIRFALAGASDYRPHDVMRGSGSPQSGFSRVAFAEFGRHGPHALAIARTWNGVSPEDAVKQLRGLEQTLAVRSDSAALEILTADNDNVESILAELESLRKSGDVAVARAARWNYAILLSRLDLPFSAAQAFAAIAREHEAGWSDEARDRAARESRVGNDARMSWQRAVVSGQALVVAGAAVPEDLVRVIPGVLRAYFYNAVRTAPSAKRVLALVSLADALDRVGDHPGDPAQHVLRNYVQRIAKRDFGRRARLAAAFEQLLTGRPVPEPIKVELTTPTTSDDTRDIVIGAMIELDAVAAHLDGFARMVERSGDPWFEIILARAQAVADQQHNDWLGAEARLRRAQKQCTPAITYQCLVLSYDLGALYENLHRVPQAIEVVYAAVRQARSAGEWLKLRQLLWQLADTERLHASTATARAYAGEVLLMAERCDDKATTNHVLTGAAILDVDGPAARRHFEAALSCRKPDLLTANYLTDIGRLDPHPDDLSRLQGWLASAREGGTLTPAQRVLADEIEGRLQIEHDRAAGAALLQQAIRAADALPRDVIADKARTGAYSALIFTAAHDRDYAQVLALIARDLRLSPPGACTVGIAAEDERSAVVVRGADGSDHGTHDFKRPLHPGPPIVPADLADHLAGCTHVQVLAQAALQGLPRVLPATLPWSYATGERHAGSVPSESVATREAQTLIVTDVTPPPDLHLPTLSARPPEPAPAMRTLSGPMATPSRVLAAMQDATEIQFHTHALVDLGISDASHLVLSPEPDGRYALTAEAIRDTTLHGRPIIVLAACHSAQGARYQHAPWSLPHAFLWVGARAVFAAGAAIPDADAGPFFTRVLERVRAGADPALALRDQRVAALAANPSSWIADVVLFE